MRIWFSGPRILGGLVRPGISFALSELAKPSRLQRGALPVRDDGELEPPPTFAEYPLHARIAAWVVFGFAAYGVGNLIWKVAAVLLG
jgi:hypothetical protein